MKRFAAIGVIVGVVGALGVLVAAGAAGASRIGASAPSRARVQGLICQHALDPSARAVSITAVMRPLHGTQRMQMRFQLLRKAGAARRYAVVNGGDLGRWIAPGSPTLGQRPGDVWKLQKPIVGLYSAPAAYRFRVSFRWLGARGRVLARVVRDSGACFQPELRPDLLVQSIKVESAPGHPQADRYVAVIRNAGASDSGPFEILFTPGALPVQTLSVPNMAAHATLTRRFIGPLCSNAAATTVTVDPEHTVDDFDRTNNAMTAVCPGV